MRSLRHENIVHMLDTFETEDQIVAVTEFADGELFQVTALVVIEGVAVEMAAFCGGGGDCGCGGGRSDCGVVLLLLLVW